MLVALNAVQFLNKLASAESIHDVRRVCDDYMELFFWQEAIPHVVDKYVSLLNTYFYELSTAERAAVALFLTHQSLERAPRTTYEEDQLMQFMIEDLTSGSYDDPLVKLLFLLQ